MMGDDAIAKAMARPGVLDGLEVSRLALQYRRGFLDQDTLIRLMPRTVVNDEAQPLAVAYAWLALFLAKVLIDLLGEDAAAQYLESCAEAIYVEVDE